MAKKKSESKTKKIEILCYNAVGKYALAYNHGDVATMEAKQADEMIANDDAKEVK